MNKLHNALSHVGAIALIVLNIAAFLSLVVLIISLAVLLIDDVRNRP